MKQALLHGARPRNKMRTLKRNLPKHFTIVIPTVGNNRNSKNPEKLLYILVQSFWYCQSWYIVKKARSL